MFVDVNKVTVLFNLATVDLSSLQIMIVNWFWCFYFLPDLHECGNIQAYLEPKCSFPFHFTKFIDPF